MKLFGSVNNRGQQSFELMTSEIRYNALPSKQTGQLGAGHFVAS